MDYKRGFMAEIWAELESIEDCDAMIAWLHLAKANLRQWEKINAKASRATKAPTGKNENPQQRKVLSAA